MPSYADLDTGYWFFKSDQPAYNSQAASFAWCRTNDFFTKTPRMTIYFLWTVDVQFFIPSCIVIVQPIGYNNQFNLFILKPI